MRSLTTRSLSNILLLSVLTPAYADLTQGQQGFEAVCAACHQATPSRDQKAPPVFAVRDHYLRVYPNQPAFVDAVTQWVASPSHDKTLMPGAVGKFGLMPPLPLPNDQLQSIAEYLFLESFAKPSGYDEHYRREHRRRKERRP